MKRVLIADDEHSLRLMIQTALKPTGVELLVASDGQEALDMIAGHMPDLVVLDWMMPKKTGVEVAAAMRDNEQLRKIPIIMLTARSQERDQEAARIVGITNYISKPFSVKQLVALVEQTLGLQPAQK